MAKNNTIFWVIGIVILAVIILNNYENLGLFSTQQVCTSNEPTTLEGYKSIFGGKISEDRLFDIIYPYSQKIIEGIIVKNCNISAIEQNTNSSFFNYFGEKIWILNDYDGNLYAYYWCSYDNSFMISVRSNNPLLENEINTIYFSTFYTCQEEQKCYSYLAETCQEVPCSSNYTKFNTLGECVESITGQNCSLLSLESRDDCCVSKFGEGYEWVENSCKRISWYNQVLYTTEGGFEFKLWMLLTGLGIIILIIFMWKK